MGNYYYGGQESRLERISWRMWMVEAACYIVLVLLTLVSSFASLSSTTGFPCFVGTVGESSFGGDLMGHGMTPARRDGVKIFFMSSPSTLFVVFSAVFVWLVVAVYLLLGGVRVKMCNFDSSYGASELSSAVATMTSLVTLSITAWAWQVFVLMLSYRQLTLAAVAFVGIFIAGLVFMLSFASGGKSPENYATFNSQLKTVCKDVHAVITAFKAVVLNLFCVVFGVWHLMLVMLGAVIMVLNFGVSIPKATTGALVVFIVLGLVYLMMIELVVSRYVHVLLGPHLGMIIALGIAGTSALSYAETLDEIMYASWKPVAAGILGAFSVIVLALAVLRAVRSYKFHKAAQSKFLQQVASVAQTVKNRARRERNGPRVHKRYYDAVPVDAYEDDPYRQSPRRSRHGEAEDVIYENMKY
ncbi:glycoprotein M [Psittacid alphaherpesvirus 1]|uniref:Envelope glycoprotein M n=1 Tax=Psittacid herpesvirus 1 (isolate Amazon parrot/-/97-0001/1997) TaxID=670426 RepID=GM_PSHV1|nr:envelope glycoprotein M [Psittacid alphaherpesvirus 1]Q6UDH4.1 RecName: Full=Envelope glycoprotein M; Short=gM [Psittacid herpesvirus 1 Amazon parrot/1997]AAQ73736.1 glycoprotein M [Psittacid alphaherpesvirus 1]